MHEETGTIALASDGLKESVLPFVNEKSQSISLWAPIDKRKWLALPILPEAARHETI
jgi:hypothetical protein